MYKYLDKLKIITIIIILLYIFFRFINKQENFSLDEKKSLIDGLKIQNSLFNSIFVKVDKKNVTMDKNLMISNHIKSNSLSTNNLTVNKNLSVKKDLSVMNNIKGKDLVLGRERINETDLKKFKSIAHLAGYAVDGDKTTHLLFEGGWHKLYGGGKFDSWANDRWDDAWIFRGWRLEMAEHGYGKGKIWKIDNKNEDVKRLGNLRNKPSSYRVTWIGY